MATTSTIASRENRLLKWRPALGDFLNGGTVRPRVMFIGTSKMMGAGAGSGIGNAIGAAAKRKTAVLAKLLTASGLVATDQGMLGGNNAPDTPGYDPRIVAGAGWSFGTGAGFHFGGNYPTNSTTTNNLSFSPVGTVDKVDIVYAQASGAGAFTVADGASVVDTVNAIGAAATLRRTVSLSSRASGKTINIARTSGNVYIFAIFAYDSQNPSIELENAGWYGSTSANWVSNGGSFGPALSGWDGYNPHLTFISGWANDQNQSVPVATMQANTQILINRAKAVNSDVVLVNEAYGSGAFGQYKDTYRQALMDLASANSCLFHDEAARVNYDMTPTWFADNAIHETAFAHADEARAYLPYFLPHLMA